MKEKSSETTSRLFSSLFSHIANTQVATNFSSKKIMYLHMPWHSRNTPSKWIKKDAMASAFSDEYATLTQKMLN